MQSTLCSSSRTHQFQFPRENEETHFIPRKPISRKLKFPLKTQSLTNSFSIDHDPAENLGGGPKRLPVVVRRDGGVSRYLWDGTCLQLTGVDGDASALPFDFDGGFGKLIRICSLAVRNFFIPKRVHDNYMDYVKWKFLHRVSSSALQVLATQAMFRAIGIGYSRSLASAAALNWVLKDGLGRLCRCIYTASLASAFDTNLKFLSYQYCTSVFGRTVAGNDRTANRSMSKNIRHTKSTDFFLSHLKRVRFSTSVVFSLSIGVELLTPTFPQYFLLLASIANIAKQISLACYLATGSAVHRSFAIADNLGEVSAKAQIQAVCFDNLGLMLAALLNMLFKNNQRLQACLPFVVYPIFSAIDLYGIYKGLQHVHLQTLTKDRLQIILNRWIEFRDVPTPAVVSKEEGIDLFWSKGEESWPIRIGCLDPKSQPIPKMSMMAMQALSSEDYYFICVETCKGSTRTKRHGVLLSLREGASTEVMIMGLLQACYIRKALLSSRGVWDGIVEGGDVSVKEWFKLISDSKRRAQGDMCLLNEYLSARGWAVKNLLLSTQEQDRYSFLDN